MRDGKPWVAVFREGEDSWIQATHDLRAELTRAQRALQRMIDLATHGDYGDKWEAAIKQARDALPPMDESNREAVEADLRRQT